MSQDCPGTKRNKLIWCWQAYFDVARNICRRRLFFLSVSRLLTIVIQYRMMMMKGQRLALSDCECVSHLVQIMYWWNYFSNAGHWNCADFVFFAVRICFMGQTGTHTEGEWFFFSLVLFLNFSTFTTVVLTQAKLCLYWAVRVSIWHGYLGKSAVATSGATCLPLVIRNSWRRLLLCWMRWTVPAFCSVIVWFVPLSVLLYFRDGN